MIENYKTSRELVKVFLQEINRRKERNKNKALQNIYSKQEVLEEY